MYRKSWDDFMGYGLALGLKDLPEFIINKKVTFFT